jgi:hypothetical protein
MDFMSPVQALLARIGDSFKSAIPAEATVKIHVDATPLQEVDASLGRNKDLSAAGSASAKVSDGDIAVDKKSTAATSEIDKAFQRIEAMATRIGYLMQKVESGKDATGNAAQELERLRNSLEKVAEKGKDAANSIGDEGMAGKLEAAAEAAGQGKGGKASSASLGDMQSIMNNPMGMLKNQLMQKFGAPIAEALGMNVGTLFSGAGGGSALGIGLGASAGALAAGAGIGWKMNTGWAGEASGDAQAALRDARLSNSMGNFDLRGETFNKAGFGSEGRVHANMLTKNGQSLDNAEVRSVLQGMGIAVGSDGFKGDAIESAMKQSRVAQGIGTSTDQIAAMVGAAIRSGAVGRDENKVNTYLQEIAGATKESAKYGVATAEKLAVIASLNQKSVQESGMLSSASSRLNMGASNALDASGQAPLQGSSGQQALSSLAGAGGDDQKAREAGFMMDAEGNLLPEYMAMVKADPYLMAMYNDFGGGKGGATMAAIALLDQGVVRAGVNQRAIRSLRGQGMNGMLAGRVMGTGGSTSAQTKGIYGIAGPDVKDIISNPLATANGDYLADVNSAKGKEQANAASLVNARQQADEQRKTGMDFAAAESIVRTNDEVSSAMKQLTNWLSTNVNVR